MCALEQRKYKRIVAGGLAGGRKLSAVSDCADGAAGTTADATGKIYERP